MTELRLTGNTYGIKDELKADGFRWNPTAKAWAKTFEDKAYATQLASAWESEGVYGEVVEKADPNQRKYFVKESWLFNLESMHDKVWCLVYDIREKNIEVPFEVAGRKITDEEGLFMLMDEADTLCGEARRGAVSGKVYGRIREIVNWRVNARYATCMASGMDEAMAGQCFDDM